MILTVIEENYCASMTLPDCAEGRHSIRRPSDGEQMLLALGTMDGWTLLETGARLLKPAPRQLENGMLLRAVCQRDQQPLMIYVESKTRDRQRYGCFLTPEQITLTIGSAAGCDVVCSDPYVEPRHLTVRYDGKGWTAEVEKGRVHVFVNGRRFRGGALRMGDMLFLMGQRFIFLPGMLCCNCPDGRVKINTQALTPLAEPKIDRADYYREAPTQPYFNRMPRFVTAVEGEKLNVDAPPAQQTVQQQSALLQMGPALTSGLFAMLGGMSSIMTVGMMASNLIFPTIGRKKALERQEAYEKRRQEAYRAYLAQLEEQLSDMAKRQLQKLQKQLPPASETARKLLKDHRHLWDRRREHADCLQLRLGTGSWPLKCDITLPPQHFDLSDDPMRAMLDELRQKERVLHHAPISFDLGKYSCLGVTGRAEDTQRMAWLLLMQLSMQMGYDEMKICLLGRLPAMVKPFSRLPHTWSDDGKHHLLARSSRELDETFSVLEEMLSARRSMPEEQQKKLPRLVILIAESQWAQQGALHRLLMEREYPGVHVITLARHTSELPRECQLIVGVNGGEGVLLNTAGERLRFAVDSADADLTAPLVSVMENTLLDMPDTASRMPDVVPFLQLFGAAQAEEMNLLTRYQRSDPARSLAVPIGMDENGGLCCLDMHERGHGFHGLIAGMTGSGKSELIMTMILSLACTFSPEEVAFALIDYKGGGTAQAFRDLPHTAGVITNLDDSSVHRALASIKSELTRRQRIFAEADRLTSSAGMNISRYQRLYRGGMVKEPLPHLFIIVDEFAELKMQQPDFMKELVSTAHIGRSLGVHLILATQKPAGVVDDQIWSNAGFRLCLRVQSPQDSQDVLRCPDAANLTGVGRFYLQSGHGSALIKAQSGFTGAPYAPMASAMPNCAIEVVDRTGYVLRHMSIQRSEKRLDAQTQLSAVTAYIRDTAQRARLSVRPLWQPPLESVPLDVLQAKYASDPTPWELSPLIGEADDPGNQRCLPVRFTLNAGRSTLIYGALGAGKTMAVMTMLQDLMARHTPEEMHIYVLDYVNEGLGVLKAAPHVGDVIAENEDEKLQRLVSMLEAEIERRKRLIGGQLADGSIPVRLRRAGLCSILVLIHGMALLQEKLADSRERLMSLLSTGLQYGVCFVGTMAASSGLSYQIAQQFSQLLVLQMPHDDDYAMLLGRVGSMRPAAARGRGLVRIDKQLFEFQTAIPREDVHAFCQELRGAWQGEDAKPIPTMPERVDAALLRASLDAAHPLHLPVGLDADSLSAVRMELDRRTVHQVLGQTGETAAFALSLAKLASAQGVEAVILDASGRLPDTQGVRILAGADVVGFVDEVFQWRMDVQAGKNVCVPQRLVILPDVSATLLQLESVNKSLADTISSSYRELLSRFLEKANAAWSMTFVVCGAPASLQKLRSESWYRLQVSPMDGLMFGGGLRNQFILEVTSGGNERGTRVFPMGYLVKNGSARLVRFAAEEVQSF